MALHKVFSQILENRTRLLGMLVFLHLVSGCNLFKKEDSPTAREVIERSIEASGGKAKINSVKSFKAEGTVTVPGVGSAEIIYLYQSGKTCLIYISSTGYTSKTIYNNERAVDIVNGEAKLINDSLRLERVKLYSHLLVEIGYLTNNYQLSIVNTEKVNGRLNYRIKIVSPLGATDYKLYDAETGLLTLLADANGYKVTYSNYQKQEGIQLSMTQKTIKKDGGIIDTEMKKLTINQAIDPKIFEF